MNLEDFSKYFAILGGKRENNFLDSGKCIFWSFFHHTGVTRADESIISWVTCRFKGRSEFSANHNIPGLLLLVKNKTDLISYWIEY